MLSSSCRTGEIASAWRRDGYRCAPPILRANPNAAPPGSLAAIAQTPQAGAPAELAYPAKVTLLQDWILIDGRQEKIRAGMRVSAEIKTGDRRVIEYLLSPVMQAAKEAGRER